MRKLKDDQWEVHFTFLGDTIDMIVAPDGRWMYKLNVTGPWMSVMYPNPRHALLASEAPPAYAINAVRLTRVTEVLL